MSGWPGDLDPDAFTAVVIHSDLRRTGTFECSDPMLNQLHSNVVWGMRGNFVDVPTDCPQRNERLGWTGDFQIFAATASFLYRIPGFTTSWLKDLAAEQGTDGPPPLVVPEVVAEKPPFPDRPVMAAWGDAAVLVPWVLYQRTGDLEFLRRQLPGMVAWLEAAAQAAGPELRFGTRLPVRRLAGPGRPPDEPGDARTPRQLVAQAYLAYSASIAAELPELLGQDDDGAVPRAVRRGPGRVPGALHCRRRPLQRLRRRPTRWPCASDCSTRRSLPRPAAAGRNRGRRRLPHRHRLRGNPAGLDALSDEGHATRLPPAAPDASARPGCTP